MVVRQVVRAALGVNRSNDLMLRVDTLDRCFDETRPSERRADRLRAMPELEPARAGLEQERCEHEEVLATDQRDVDVLT